MGVCVNGSVGIVCESVTYGIFVVERHFLVDDLRFLVIFLRVRWRGRATTPSSFQVVVLLVDRRLIHEDRVAPAIW